MADKMSRKWGCKSVQVHRNNYADGSRLSLNQWSGCLQPLCLSLSLAPMCLNNVTRRLER